MAIDITASVLQTDRPPELPARKVASFKPNLLQTEDHHLCPGCGEPIPAPAGSSAERWPEG